MFPRRPADERRVGVGIDGLNPLGSGVGLTQFEFAHANPGTTREDHEDRQSAFEQHRTVTNCASIRFTGDLLAAGPTADEAMKSTHGPTGDGDE